MTVIQLAVLGMNKQIELTGLSWNLWAGDVSTAFLQGEPQERDLPLFMRAPRDEIQKEAETFPAVLYEVLGNLYGFASAPRTWITHVIKVLTSLKFRQHRLDRMCFYKRCTGGNILVILIVHVDDFLVAYREDYDINELLKAFTWGTTTLLAKDTPIIYRGKELTLHENDGVYTIHVTQKAFIEEIEKGQVKRGTNLEQDLSPDLRKEFKSVAGSLQWLSGQCRPDLCAVTSLANRGKETKIMDLKAMYEAVDVAKQTTGCLPIRCSQMASPRRKHRCRRTELG